MNNNFMIMANIILVVYIVFVYLRVSKYLTIFSSYIGLTLNVTIIMIIIAIMQYSYRHIILRISLDDNTNY